MYDKAKITEWGNLDNTEKFYGVAVRRGRKWQHCTDGKTPFLHPSKDEAKTYQEKIVLSLKERGLWSEKKKAASP